MALKIKKRTITKFLNNEYRDFAIYTINSRGIPNAEDSLTPVQRLILLFAPEKFEKTISLTGDVMKTGFYHHGDAPLNGAIQKLAKEFQCSEPLLIGDGFFGSLVNHQPASPRYTSIKLNPKISKIVRKYQHLNEKNLEGNFEILNLYIPLGLLTMTLGISVGYTTKILPRKLEDMVDYLSGKKNKVIPFFKGWKGKIEKYNDAEGCWLLTGEFEVNGSEIKIKSIPPILQYKSFLKKIEKIVNEAEETIEVDNLSTDKIDLTLKFKNEESRLAFQDRIINSIKLIFTENIVFVWKGKVVEYANIYEYLNDYKSKNINIDYNNIKYLLTVSNADLDYAKALLEYLKFMLEKNRKHDEIETFLNRFKNDVKKKLEDVRLRQLSLEEVKKQENKILDIDKEILNLEEQLKEQTEKLIPLNFQSTKKMLSSIIFDEEIDEFLIHDFDTEIEKEQEENES